MKQQLHGRFCLLLKLLDPHPTILHFNTLIRAYSSLFPYLQCFYLYSQILRRSLAPVANSFTFLFIACANLRDPSSAHMIHAQFSKLGFNRDVYASTALIDTYAKLGLLRSATTAFDEMDDGAKGVPTWNCLLTAYARNGHLEEASRLFFEMPSRNVISWTALISGFTQNGKYGEALELYSEMERIPNLKPNAVTIASILPSCANLGALNTGRRIEAYARENGFIGNRFVGAALLDLYARCGVIEKAMELFREMGGAATDLCSLNSMMMGLAVHGRCEEAIGLFNQMQRKGTSPDDVTFVAAILACTHGRMVETGWKLFNSMERSFSIAPKLEHFGCMVDLLGRAGLLQQAYHLISAMPMNPDSVVWGALLGACSFHGNVELGKKAAEALFFLEPHNPGNYVLLSNIYADAGMWDRVSELRRSMRRSLSVTKAAGHSLIEEGSRIHKFIVEDRSHPRSKEIFAVLDYLFQEDDDDDDDDEIQLFLYS
ncbi:hypothetical protein M569_08386 [Genlisea aurea]|uniref:Pentatricopeptide repeat-containing protein n=1 Tax=Genlisea aurea TaxID=192259 RepID=S8CHG7_9LAMI|nr:hypothetical protein M569_08386 [Genlisea aurea]